MVSITSDRCPYRKQNREYCEYLLKALYYESRNREDWEITKADFDYIKYEPENNEEPTENQIVVEKLSNLLNEGENVKTISDYKTATLQQFNLKNEIPLSSSV